MDTKFKQLTGIKKSEFDQFVKVGQIQLRAARLIPLINPGKEEALTSIFLSSLTLIDEFRNDILNSVGIPSSGKLYVYTEVTFPDTDDLRLDGLILIVRGGRIKSAAILEMKNGSDTLGKEQVQSYLKIAKTFQIPKMITVSNEFVSEPTQSPLGTIKTPKGVSLYHLSWQFIRTLAHIRLFENETNIEDEDQVRIMEEVVRYLENEKSGVGTQGFSRMKPGWKTITEKVTSQATIKKTDNALLETIHSWLQEERDLALKLSCGLGDLVRTDTRKYRGNIQARIDHDLNEFLKSQTLSSTLSVKAAVSDITVRANFQHKTVEMSVNVLPPKDKTLRGQFGWIKGQVENRHLKKRLAENPTGSSILEELFVELIFKHARKPYRFPYGRLEYQAAECKGREINKVSIIHVKNFGRHFSAPKKFVELIEKMLPRFYKEIVQYQKNWVQPAPKIPNKPPKEDIFEIADPEPRSNKPFNTPTPPPPEPS